MPERHNVVEGFIDGWNFHQINTALAPLAFRLHPYTGAALVEHAVVLIVIKVPIPLQQAKALGVVIAEAVKAQMGRVFEGSPEPFATTRKHSQAIGIVNLGAPVVIHAPAVFTHLIHAGQRCNAGSFHFSSGVKRHIYIHHHVTAGVENKGVCPRGAGRIEQTPYPHHVTAWLWSFQPVGAEPGKLLFAVYCGINGQPTGRHAVLHFGTNCTEVTGTKERSQIAGEVGLIVQAEAGIAQVGWKVAEWLLTLVGKIIRVIPENGGLSVNHLMKRDGRLKIQPQMEELRLKGRVAVGPEGVIFAKPDGLVVVPADLFETFGQLAFVGDVRVLCQLTGIAFQPRIAEWLFAVSTINLCLPRKYQRRKRQCTGTKPRYQGLHEGASIHSFSPFVTRRGRGAVNTKRLSLGHSVER